MPFRTRRGVIITGDRGTTLWCVKSPILMNLFMHYAFDYRMQRTFAQFSIAGYADDTLVLSRI